MSRLKVELEIHSVEDKLPQYCHDCIAWFKDGGVYVAWFRAGHWYVRADGVNEDVTHWAMFPLDIKKLEAKNNE